MFEQISHYEPCDIVLMSIYLIQSSCLKSRKNYCHALCVQVFLYVTLLKRTLKAPHNVSDLRLLIGKNIQYY